MIDPEAPHAEQLEIWLDHVNAMVASGVKRTTVAESMLTMALTLALAEDGARATSRNLYLVATNLSTIADRNETSAEITASALSKAGLKLN